MSVLSSAVDFVSGYMPQLTFGSFLFSLNTAAFQTLERDTQYQWAGVPRFGQNDALQFTGPGEDVIRLPGVIYPQYRGGPNQLKQLRALAAQGLPQHLVDGGGNVYGRWVATEIHEGQQYFAAFGQFLRQDFSVALRWYDGGPSNLLLDLLKGTKVGGLITGAQQALSTAQSEITSITGVGNIP